MSLPAETLIEIAGAVMILAGFSLNLFGRLDRQSYPYLLLNVAGAAILAVVAWQHQRWGFLLLEGVWTLVALAGLVTRLLGKEPAGGH